MSLQILTAAITILVPTFTSKLYDLTYLDEKEKKDMNSTGRIAIDDKYRSDKSNMMLIVSCALIIIGVVLSSSGCNSTTMGLSYAGLLLLVYTLMTNWWFYSLKCQVMILGACIAAIGAVGMNADLMRKLMFC
jgi:hypothetical protein